MALAIGVTGLASAESRLATFDALQVTATREPEPVDRIPASITVIDGADLRARGANDLRTALSLVVGVEGTPGGDGGPAGSVPAIWGLREADAFLLVVDQVPWGGAFNPATPSLDLTGVERIEILRGAAPVMFGATSFSGVINVIHFDAGRAPATAIMSTGSNGSYGAAVTFNLATIGNYRQSVAVSVDERGYADDRTRFRRYHVNYRGAADLGFATAWVDGDVSVLPQKPAGNLLLRDGATLYRELPVDANYNPAGAKLDQQRYHLALGLDRASRLGNWSATLALTRTLDDILRGFLRGGVFSNSPDGGIGDGLQADGYSQTRGITDVYVDAHVTTQLSPSLNLTYGADYLYGSGSQHAVNFGYCVDADGVERSCDGARHADEIVRSSDVRHFAGLYSQLDWKVTARVGVFAGLRINHTREATSGEAIDNTGPSPVVAFDGADALSKTRGSGIVGVNWRAWSTGADAVTLYADYRNTYKPLAVDFGPEAEVEALKPETAESIEVGARMRWLDGKLDLDTNAFRVDFRNGLTYADDGAGNVGPSNGGRTRFRGIELEMRYTLSANLRGIAHFASHDARFVRYTRDNGADASGNRVEMSPRQLGGIGFLYARAAGFNGSLVANYSGRRMLNKSNSVDAGGYSTLNGSIGFSLGKWRLQLNG